MPVLAKKIYTYGNILEQGFGSEAKFSGCREPHKINFTTDVAEGKTRRHPRFIGDTSFTYIEDVAPKFSSLVLRAFTEAYRCVKFIFSLDLLFLLGQAKRKENKYR